MLCTWKLEMRVDHPTPVGKLKVPPSMPFVFCQTIAMSIHCLVYLEEIQLQYLFAE
jgi:hypothetical protein